MNFRRAILAGFFGSLLLSPSREGLGQSEDEPEDPVLICGERDAPIDPEPITCHGWVELPKRDPVIEICLLADGEIVRCIPADTKKLFRGKKFK